MNAINEFNQTVLEFLTRMMEAFPQEAKLKAYYHKFNLVKSANTKKPVEMFMENCIPYGFQIMSKDERFFQQEQYINHAESISGKMGLLTYWYGMPQETKESIWKYVQTLYVLGMKNLGLVDDLKKILTEVQESEKK